MSSEVPSQSHDPAPPVTGGVRLLLRVEGAALFAAATFAFVALGGPWWLYALLFLAPDLSFLGYLGGPRLGAMVYNAAHTTIAPALLAGLTYAIALPIGLLVAAIWAAHVGFDRLLGYGLKYATGFSDTHLGRIGRR